MRAAVAFLSLSALVLSSCEPPPPPPTVPLPSGLNLAALTAAQQGLLRATVAVSGGALQETEVELDVAASTIAGAFTLQNVAERTERTFTLRIHGRFADDTQEVVLGELNQPITLLPASDAVISLEGAAFVTCLPGIDGSCAGTFDRNRNGTSNIDDLLPPEAGGRGIDPAPQAPFLVTSATQLQFPSGVRLGSFARQLVVIENFGANPVEIVSAAVVGGQGFSLSILDPSGLSVQTPQRTLDATQFPSAVGPSEEAFIAVSFAPVNSFVTTGALFVVAEDTVTGVRQAARVKLIANPDGGLRPADPTYVEAVIDGGTALVGTVGVPVLPFPAGPLFSGEPVTAEDVPQGGVPRPSAPLVLNGEGGVSILAASLGFAVDMAPGTRLSAALDGTDADLDLAIVDIDGVIPGELSCPTCRSQGAGAGAEAAELFNASEVTRRVVIMLGRADDDPRDVVPFRLSATLTRGPEFAAGVPIAPTTGPQEGGITITLRGTGFQPGASVAIGGADALDVVVRREIDGTGTIALTLPAQVGQENPATIVVLNPGVEDGGDGQAATLLEAFTYQPPAPSIDDVSPALATATGGAVDATISGRFFSGRHGAPRVTFRDAASGAVATVDATLIDASTLRVTPPASPVGNVAGVVQLRVQNRVAPDGSDGAVLGATSNPLAFRYVVADGPAPTVTAVSPASGSVDGGEVVVVTGSGLRAGAQVLFGGRAGTCTGPVDDALTCTTPAQPGPDLLDVVAVNPDGQAASLAAAFTVVVPAPTIASVFPASVSAAGGTLVVVEGEGFRAGLSASFAVSGGALRFPAAATTRVSATTLLVTTPALPVGTVTLEVRNSDGQVTTTTLAVFSADGAPVRPVILGVAPGAGDIAGGYDVVIEGQDFRAPRVVFGGVVLSGVFVDGAPPALDRFTITAPPSPTGAASLVEVQVTNDDDSSSDAARFIYTATPQPPPRIDAITPSTIVAGPTTTVTIDGARFDPARARVLVRGVDAVIESRSPTRLVAGIATAGLPAGVNLVVIENGDGQSASATITVTPPPPPPPTPTLTSLSPTTLHALVPGDELIVLGTDLDQGDIEATLTPGAPSSPLGSPVSARVVARTRTSVTLEVPTLGAGEHFVALTFSRSPTSTTIEAGGLTLRAPTVGLAQTTARNGGTELTLLGDSLNPRALVAVELLDLGQRPTPCVVGSTSEGIVRCQTALPLRAGTSYRPQLTYRGRFDDQDVIVVLDALALGALDGVGAVALDAATITVRKNTAFATVPTVVAVAVTELDPGGLPETLEARIVDDRGLVRARGSATIDFDTADVLIDDGRLVDLSASPSPRLTLELVAEGDVVVRGDVELQSRRVTSAGSGTVIWPGLVQPITGDFVVGEAARVVAAHPVEALTRPGNAIAFFGSIRMSDTRALAIGQWNVCLADQVDLNAPLELCAPLVVNQRAAELEQNGAAATATAVALNLLGEPAPTSINGTMGATDVDQYFFLATSGVQRVKATITGTCSAGLVARIVDRATGAVLGEETSSGVCAPIEADLPAVGDYLVELSGGTATYALRVDQILPRVCGDGIVTPNEQCDDGGLNGLDCAPDTCLEPGEPDDAVRRVALETDNNHRTLTPGDVDRYVVTLAAPTFFGLGAVRRTGRTGNNVCNGALRVTLRDGRGDVITSDVSFAPTACPFIDELLPAGSYLIDVEATDPLAIERYRLFTFPVPNQPAPLCGNGVLQGSEECDGTDECTDCIELEEPNDVLGDAKVLPAPVIERSLGAAGGDVDLWRLQDLVSAAFTATLVRTDGQRCDGALAIDLLDEAGVVIDGAVSGGPDGCPLMDVSQQPGTYLLRVEAASSPTTSAAYRLDVDFDPFCGDGVIDAGEACDEGPANNPGGPCSELCVVVP